MAMASDRIQASKVAVNIYLESINSSSDYGYNRRGIYCSGTWHGFTTIYI